MLAYHGFVQQEQGSRAYVAGPALIEVGLAVVGTMNVRDQARPFMEQLAEDLEETVHLGVLDGTQVRYVAAIESERALRVVARTGQLDPRPLHVVGGRPSSPWLPDDQVLRLTLLRLSPSPRSTKKSITRLGELEAELEQVCSPWLRHELWRDGGGRGLRGRGHSYDLAGMPAAYCGRGADQSPHQESDPGDRSSAAGDGSSSWRGPGGRGSSGS